MATMQVDVVSAAEQLYSGQAEEVYARSMDGEIGILPGHQPILVMLDKAPVRVKSGGSEQSFDLAGGFLEFRDNHLIVIAEGAEEE